MHRKVVDYALKALLYEVAATPKPGLVDRANNGAHSDMDFYTFLDSSVELRHYFEAIAQYIKGQYNHKNESKTLHEGDMIFSGLKTLGIQAEQDMKKATGGINTHKGAIYALGLLVAAVTELELYNTGKLQIEDVTARVSEYVGPSLEKEFIENDHTSSYGVIQYRTLGMLGARGEAYRGFETVRTKGLPALESGLKMGLSINDAMIGSLLAIIADLEDSNVIGRHSPMILKESQAFAKSILEVGAMTTEKGREMISQYDEWCIAHRISHGGSADLVAVALFLYWIKNN
ncbi:MAG: triphosphoribosyl-dephospho-CoA synthase [Clostridiales bacterium]|nr:triphosphoribosyl-dephospho-CoA synthase [Clostridiales bacterium]